MPRGKGFRERGARFRQCGGIEEVCRNQRQSLSWAETSARERLRDAGESGKEIYDVTATSEPWQDLQCPFSHIKGHFLNFQETFPDDGDVDMIKAIRVYKEVGYDG